MPPDLFVESGSFSKDACRLWKLVLKSHAALVFMPHAPRCTVGYFYKELHKVFFNHSVSRKVSRNHMEENNFENMPDVMTN